MQPNLISCNLATSPRAIVLPTTAVRLGAASPAVQHSSWFTRAARAGRRDTCLPCHVHEPERRCADAGVPRGGADGARLLHATDVN